MRRAATGVAVVTACAALALAACGSNGGRIDGPEPPSVPVGTEFTLAPGQAAVVGTTGLVVSFVAVNSDSRCPTDVQCVWEGDAVVALSVGGAGTTALRYELHTGGSGSREIVHAGYTVELRGLMPHPRSDAPIAPASYRATFVVRAP